MIQIIIPIVFLFLFVIFVYGALFIGLLGVANWLLHVWLNENSSVLNQFSHILLNYGFFGVFLLAFILLLMWIAFNFLLSYGLYLLVRISGRKIGAYKTYNITIIGLFHIFAMPVILWGVIRQNSPYLKHKYFNKLRKLSTSTMMKERLNERKLKATNRS